MASTTHVPIAVMSRARLRTCSGPKMEMGSTHVEILTSSSLFPPDPLLCASRIWHNDLHDEIYSSIPQSPLRLLASSTGNQLRQHRSLKMPLIPVSLTMTDQILNPWSSQYFQKISTSYLEPTRLLSLGSTIARLSSWLIAG